MTDNEKLELIEKRLYALAEDRLASDDEATASDLFIECGQLRALLEAEEKSGAEALCGRCGFPESRHPVQVLGDDDRTGYHCESFAPEPEPEEGEPEPPGFDAQAAVSLLHDADAVLLERIEALEKLVEGHTCRLDDFGEQFLRDHLDRTPEPDSEPEPKALDADIQNLQRHAFEAGFMRGAVSGTPTKWSDHLAAYMHRDTPRVMRDLALARLRSRPSEEEIRKAYWSGWTAHGGSAANGEHNAELYLASLRTKEEDDG